MHKLNILLCKFHVQIELRWLCLTLYIAHLWSNYRKDSLRRLQAAYAMRLLLSRQWCTASQIFAAAAVDTCKSIFEKCVVCRLSVSDTVIQSFWDYPMYDLLLYDTNPSNGAIGTAVSLWVTDLYNFLCVIVCCLMFLGFFLFLNILDLESV